ncbi:MAG: hypothetical protein COA42_05450 [Alteromonadaceae bacterium]|nr:MAG: hypothetical protein COA42_05450 [Alteromonadaceae bacterium]
MPSGKPKVLLVDDQEVNVELLDILLEPLELATYKAFSGQDAIDLCQENEFFLILMDIQMPGFDGFETARRILDHPDTADTPIIFITANVHAQHFEHEAYRSGAVDYLFKPVDEHLLTSKVIVFQRLWEQKRALMHYQQSLEGLVELRTKSLHETMKELVKSNQVKDQFLAVINHELRTPLNGVQGALNLLNDFDLSSEQQELISAASSSLHHLVDIVESILLITETNVNALKPEKKILSLRRGFNDIIKYFRNSASSEGITFNFNVDPQVPELLMGDLAIVTRVVDSLLSNAVKFTREGEVSLSIMLDDDFDLMPSDEERVAIRISVMDTGIGIADNQRETIFKLFRQVEGNRNRRFGGLGIGLPLCHSLVSLLDGILTLDSELNRGTQVHVVLPMCMVSKSDAQLHSDESEVCSECEGGSRNVLIVEDNQVNVLILKKVVERCGYHALTAVNGEEALTVLDTSAVDLILMDCQMPVMDGFEATRRIRASKDSIKNAPIIAVTANTTSIDRAECLQAGMNDYLSKPINFDVLKAKLSYWLAVT